SWQPPYLRRWLEPPSFGRTRKRKGKHGGEQRGSCGDVQCRAQTRRVCEATEPDCGDTARADREPDHEAGGGADVTGHVLLAHHHRHAERSDHGYTDECKCDCARDAADRKKKEHERTRRDDAGDKHVSAAETISQWSEQQRSDPAC